VEVAANLAVVVPARKEMRSELGSNVVGWIGLGGEATATAAVVATTATVTGAGAPTAVEEGE